MTANSPTRAEAHRVTGRDDRLCAFVSYARESTKRAHSIAGELETESELECFVCERNGPQGFATQERSEHAAFLSPKIQASTVFIALWNRNYARAAWCLWELKTAAEAGVSIVVVRQDATRFPPEISTLAILDDDVPARELACVARRTSPVRTPQSISGALLVNAGYSLLDAPDGSVFAGDRPTSERAWLRARPVVLSLALQMAIWLMLRAGLPSDATSLHLWSLLAATSIAITVVAATAVAVMPAAVVGPILLPLSRAALEILPMDSVEDTSRFVAFIAALQVASIVGVRGILVDEPAVRRRISSFSPQLRAAVGACVACLCLGAAMLQLPGDPSRLRTLQYLEADLRAARTPVDFDTAVRLGISSAARRFSPEEGTVVRRQLTEAAAIEMRQARRDGDREGAVRRFAAILRRRLGLEPDADTPVKQGLLIGCILGLAFGVLLAQRYRNSLRTSEARFGARSALWFGGGMLVGVGIGWALGATIQYQPAGFEPIGAWAGAYAGLQVGVVLTACGALSAAFGGVELDTTSERWWSCVSLAAGAYVLSRYIRRLPFGRMADFVGENLLAGTVLGVCAGIAAAALWERGARARSLRPTIGDRELSLCVSALGHGALFWMATAVLPGRSPASPESVLAAVETTLVEATSLGHADGSRAPSPSDENSGGTETNEEQAQTRPVEPPRPTHEELDEMPTEELRGWLDLMTAEERTAFWTYYRSAHPDLVERVERRDRHRALVAAHQAARSGWRGGGGGGAPLFVAHSDNGRYIVHVAPGYSVRLTASFGGGSPSTVTTNSGCSLHSDSGGGEDGCTIPATENPDGMTLDLTGPGGDCAAHRTPIGFAGNGLQVRFEDWSDGDCNEPSVSFSLVDEWALLEESPNDAP